MKIIRYLGTDGRTRHAAQQSDGVVYDLDGDLYRDRRVTDRRADIAKVLAPVAPTAILGIGLNYRRHAAETNAPLPEYPIVFAKTLNALQNPGGPILLPTFLRSDQVDYECELAVVIGREGKNIRPDQALDYVLGYTAANDVSARDWQIARGGSQWTRGKSFDTFCPLGPCLVTPDDIPDRPGGQQRSRPGLEHERHDLRCPRSNRLSFGQRYPAARNSYPDRHPARRRHGPHASPLAPAGRHSECRGREDRDINQSRRGRTVNRCFKRKAARLPGETGGPFSCAER